MIVPKLVQDDLGQDAGAQHHFLAVRRHLEGSACRRLRHPLLEVTYEQLDYLRKSDADRELPFASADGSGSTRSARGAERAPTYRPKPGMA